MPDGVPATFQRSHTPASDDLPKLVDAAITSKSTFPPSPDTLRRYQSLVSALLYCSTQTRPDVAYAVRMLCRAMGCPTPALPDAALRVFAYLHHYKHVGLRYELCPDPNVQGHPDSDWATRHSTSGWIFMHGLAAISWSSKK
eukprot:6188872-Pleurochrysis_carterae.AAC.2